MILIVDHIGSSISKVELLRTRVTGVYICLEFEAALAPLALLKVLFLLR